MQILINVKGNNPDFVKILAIPIVFLFILSFVTNIESIR